MCESFGAPEVSRWPVLAAGILLVVGSIGLGWRSRRIAVRHQRRMEEAKDRPMLWLLYHDMGGYLGPELHQISLLFTATVGLVGGMFLLALGICGGASS